MKTDWKISAERALGNPIANHEPVSGGSISPAFRITTGEGKHVFAKTAEKSTPLFKEEAAGLAALAKVKELRVAKVLHADDHVLLLDWIEEEPADAEFWPKFGRQLAHFHAHPVNQFGWTQDNHIGMTPQANPLRATGEIDWAEYFIDYRLKPMLHHPALVHDALLQASYNKVSGAIEKHLARVKEKPCLLHGDLWSGNFLCGPEQTPFLIDPAPYYGHRETDLAMTELFGGFEREFYDAYWEEFPLSEGYEVRRTIYNLYHLLNHWILFGESYRGQTLQALNHVSAY